ncbi:MAG: TerB family tellurite resistance protein [Flavobacteriales bacterium]|jgi:uncharacterized tellurite resistance protein B-like protein|nr:TerB family tellurite resistance protein [Flavobacteriales bacterium]
MDEKLSLLSELIELSKSDGEVSPDEIHFIHTISKMIGLTEEQALNLFENPAPFVPPKSEFERILQFHRLVLLMNVDRDVDGEELEKIKQLGLRMGLAPAAILEVLRRMYDYENHVIPPNELINIFTKYHN